MNGKRIMMRLAAGGLMAGALIAGGAMWSGTAHAWGGHRHGDVGMAGALPVLAMVKEADLTQDQEHQVANILRNHKAALEAKGASAAEARRAMMQHMTADAVDANALAAAWDRASATHKDLTLEWAQVRQEVQALLTPQQVSEMKEMRDKFMKKVDERHAEREKSSGGRLDKWIDRLSK